MSESSGILPSGSDADLQEQGVAGPTADAASAAIADAGTGGSEADRLEQGTPTHPDDATARGVVDGEGTGGSEADRLEQAVFLPDDHEDAFSRGGEEAGPTL